MDDTDRRLLDALQGSLPLVERPFAEVAAGLGIPEEEAVSRAWRLSEEDVLRDIGCIFNAGKLGFQSALFAAAVAPERLDAAAGVVSAHSLVSHNYAREAEYNLWFTLAAPPGRSVEEEGRRLAREAGATAVLYLPTLRTFKLGVRLVLSEDDEEEEPDLGRDAVGLPAEPVELNHAERAAVRALQGPLEITAEPFAPRAGQIGVSPAELLARARQLQELGVLRRFTAVLRHRQAGFAANGLGLWRVGDEDLERAGEILASRREVTHCYERPAHPPEWPWRLYTMLHARTREEAERVYRELAAAAELPEPRVLFSEKEYKKQRAIYPV